jgi:hypothetical protein
MLDLKGGSTRSVHHASCLLDGCGNYCDSEPLVELGELGVEVAVGAFCFSESFLSSKMVWRLLPWSSASSLFQFVHVLLRGIEPWGGLLSHRSDLDGPLGVPHPNLSCPSTPGQFSSGGIRRKPFAS